MNIGLALTSALLLILVFPRFNFTWLAPIALAPVLIACAREASARRRFLAGWLGGALFWGSVCYWIQFVLEVHGGMGRWGGWGTFFLFAIYKGLHFGAFAWLAGFAMRRWWSVPAVAALWTGIERTHGPMAFAWLDLGNAGIDMPFLARLAPITGVYGLSFVFALTAGVVAVIALRRPRIELAWLGLVLVLPLLPPLPEAAPGDRTALVVQPNVDTEALWTQESLTELERNLALLSRGGRADMILWPETPAPFYPSSEQFREFTASIARAANTNFLFGAVGRTEGGAPLNSGYLLRPDGSQSGRYDKINLVPFGEYVPSPFAFVNKITNEAGDFVPGARVVTFALNGSGAGRKLGAFICYESAFPDFVRQFVRDGANVLVNLSNDGYFGGSAAREQHLAIARMRAAENARWILRSTNDGITASIDPAGRVRAVLPSYQQISGGFAFSYRSDITPYTQHGDWLAWGCLMVGLGTSFAGMRARRL